MSKGFRSLYINNEKRRVIPAVLYILTAFVGSMGTVFSFVSCFSFAKEFSFYLIWILLTLGVCLLYLIDRFRDKLLAVFLLGTAGYVLIRFHEVTASAVSVCNIIIRDINASYHMDIERIVLPQNFVRNAGTEAALILFAVIITFLTAYFVLGRSSVVGCLCVSMPVSIFGIFFDIFPKLEFFLLAVTFWVSAVILHTSGKRGKRNADGAVYNALFAAVSIWIIYFFSQAVMPREQYVRYDFLEQAKNYIENKVSALTVYYDGSDAGIGQGTFGRQDEVRFNGDTILEAVLPAFRHNIYLRTTEYNEYMGNAWSNNDTYFQNYFNGSYEEMGRSEQPQNITASILKNLRNELYVYDTDIDVYEELVTEYKIRIRHFTASDVPFAPYGTEFDTDRMKTDIMPAKKLATAYEYDVYTADNLWRFCELFPTEKFLSYWNMISAKLPTIQDTVYYQLLSGEEEYAAFVRKAYTQVPPNLKEVLRRYAPETVEYDYASEMEFAGRIQRMFADNYQYTLAPGAVPPGIDGVEYFLNESRKGYCVYFASAATLIFRQAGIPARYVEGFVITPDMMREGDADGNVTVTVKDDKAHAWAEIYIAGYGWIPVEVTPGFYAENVYVGQQQTESAAQEESGSVWEEGTTVAEQKETNADKERRDEEEESAVPGGRLIKVLSALIGILAVAFALYFLYELSGRERKKKVLALFDGKDGAGNRERVLLAWWYIEKLLSFKHITMPDNLPVFEQKQFLKEHFEFFSNEGQSDKIDGIMETYFGNKTPTDEETEETIRMARSFREWMYSDLSSIEKVRFQYIHRL